jgi:tetratricopeptide (TPR) repeat protein
MPSADLGTKGELAKVPLPRLLYELLRRAFSGTLVLTPREGEVVHVAFVDGLPVDCDHAVAEDALARVLLEQGWISHEDYNKSLEEMAKQPAGNMSEVWAQQGKLLLQGGAIDEERFLKGQRLQLRRKLNRLFAIKDADYALREGEFEGLARKSERQIDPLPVIFHGVCNVFDEARLAREFETLGEASLRPAKGFAVRAGRFAHSPQEQELAQMLGKSKGQSIGRILSQSKLGELKTRMLVYALWVTGALVTGEAKASAAQATPRAKASADPAPAASTQAAPTQAAPTQAAPTQGAGLDDLLAQYVSSGGDAAEAAPTKAAKAAPPKAAEPAPPKAPEPAPTKAAEPPMDRPVASVEEIPLPDAPINTGDFPAASIAAASTGLMPGATGSQPQGVAIKPMEPDQAPDPGSIKRLRGNITSILGSINKIATADYEVAQDNQQSAQKRSPSATFRAASPPPSSAGEPAVPRSRPMSSISHPVAGADASAAPAAQVQKPAPKQTTLQLGITHFENKNYVTAHKYFVEAAKAQPQDGRPLAWLGRTRQVAPGTDADQDPGRTKKLMLRAIQLSPQNPDCHFFLADLYVSLGDEGRALTCYQRAVEIDPTHREARQKLDELKQKHGLGGKKKGAAAQNIYGQARKEKQATGLLNRILKK